jgi:hypothetical protein
VAGSAFGKFLALPSCERRLLVRAILTVGVARLTLKLLPFARVRRLLTPRPGSRVRAEITRDAVRWAVHHAQRVIPDATCLPQAVAAEALLTRGGHPVLLRIGVTKREDGGVLAHAWAESGGRIVVGDLPGGLGGYAHLPPLPAAWATSEGDP